MLAFGVVFVLLLGVFHRVRSRDRALVVAELQLPGSGGTSTQG